ncbi:MAG TPA: hypothetical protein VFP08_04350 [Acidimicrobiales bacterium]|nr:hypothetical protein [Acidimicrobiales bacterium]
MRGEGGWGPIAAGAVIVVVAGAAALVLSSGANERDPSRVNAGNSDGAPFDATANPVAVTVGTTGSTVASTTTIAIPTTVEPTTTVPTTPIPPPAQLVAAATDLDMGIDRSDGVIAIGNSGGQRLDWATSTDNALVAATNGGSLGPGEQTDVTISVNRSGLVEGEYLATVSILGAGHAVPISVRWRVERAPVPRVTVAPPGLDDASTCPRNTPALTGVVAAAVIDESPVTEVVMTWTGPGPEGSAALTETAPGSWTAPLGPLTGPGSWTITVRATDARGNIGHGATTLTVTACPDRPVGPGRPTTTTQPAGPATPAARRPMITRR